MTAYVVVSVGPDYVDSTNISPYPWSASYPLGGGIYDPSNGTKSLGDIFRASSARVPRGWIEPITQSAAFALEDPYL